MTDKEPRLFLEEVIETIAVLLRRSSNSEGLEILGKYEDEVLASSPDEILSRVVTLTEVNKLFEDFDIDKGLITITPDIEYSKINDCRQGYIEKLQFFDCLGERFVYPTQAIYIIFNECVLGLNWTTNTCDKHTNCMENCRKKAFEFMNKYASSSKNLVPVETVIMEIKELKEEECYFHQQVDINDVLNLGVTNGDNSLDFYKRIINLFHLPKNGPLTELHSAPIQGITLSYMLGWIIQFIGPIDKNNELLANVLVSNMEFAIEKDIEKTVAFMRDELVVRGREGTRRIFKPYGAQEDTHIQSKYEKMAEKARLRKLAVQQKKNKKGGKQNSQGNLLSCPADLHNPTVENERACLKTSKEMDEARRAQDSQWKDLSDEHIEGARPNSKEEIYQSIVTINGHRYGSNYSLLKNGPRKENPQKFFFIDIDEWQKLIDMESMMGFEWTKDEKYLEDLESFVKMTGIKKFVIRRLQEHYMATADSGRFFQFEEAVEIASISLELKGEDPNEHGMLEFLKADRQGLNEHVRRSRSMSGMEALFLMNGIDKSTITVIPDFVEKLSQIHAEENIYTPITTIGRKGEDLMNMSESALYIFKHLICGVDWSAAVMTNGIDAYEDFRQTFEDTLKPLFCDWEACYVAKDWHEESITKLKRHKIFENQPRADLNFFEVFPKGSLVPTPYFNDQCEANGLPPMPENLPEAMLLAEARILMMVVWACQFHPHQERSREQGDRAMQRGVIISAMFARFPQEAKLHNHLENLITHWSEPGRMQSQRAADEKIRKTEFRLRETFLNAPHLLPSNTFDTSFGNLISSTRKALKAFESQRENSSQSADQKKIIEMWQNQIEAQRKMTNAKQSVEAPDASAKSEVDLEDSTVELSSSSQSVNKDVQKNSEKASKPTKTPIESLEKTEKVKEPKKEDKGNSKEPFSKSTKPQEGLTKKSKSKTSAISKESSRSSSTSFSEQSSSQKPIPETREKNHGLLNEEAMEKKKFEDQEKKMVKMQNQIKELKDQVKLLSEENETLKSSIEERKEGDSNKLKKVKKDLEKEKETTASLEQAIKDWKVSLEFMEKDLMEAGEQRDTANEKLRKVDEELREQTAKSRNVEHQLKESNKILAMMNKEKDVAVERVLREWTERWNVERHQVQLAQTRTVEAESKVRQLMKEKVKLLEKSGDGSNLPAHVATYKEDIRKLRQLLKEKDDLIPHLQKRIQDLSSNQPGPSSQISEDFNGYLERVKSMLKIVNRDDSIEEKRVRISRLLTNTDSDETRQISVLEEDLFDASVTMYRDTLNYNMFKVQQTQSTSESQPIPSYPDLSQRFLDAENKERTKAMFGEGDCAICFEKIEKHDEERKCPNEICALSYHGKCILKSIETMPFCPYCKTPYYNVDDFPFLS